MNLAEQHETAHVEACKGSPEMIARIPTELLTLGGGPVVGTPSRPCGRTSANLCEYAVGQDLSVAHHDRQRRRRGQRSCEGATSTCEAIRRPGVGSTVLSNVDKRRGSGSRLVRDRWGGRRATSAKGMVRGRGRRVPGVGAVLRSVACNHDMVA